MFPPYPIVFLPNPTNQSKSVLIFLIPNQTKLPCLFSCLEYSSPHGTRKSSTSTTYSSSPLSFPLHILITLTILTVPDSDSTVVPMETHHRIGLRKLLHSVLTLFGPLGPKMRTTTLPLGGSEGPIWEMIFQLLRKFARASTNSLLVNKGPRRFSL